MPLQRKPLPVLADTGYWFLDIYPPQDDWMFLDFTIRAFLNIPAKDGIFDQHQASSIKYPVSSIKYPVSASKTRKKCNTKT